MSRRMAVLLPSTLHTGVRVELLDSLRRLVLHPSELLDNAN
jgi:hypothetical protein